MRRSIILSLLSVALVSAQEHSRQSLRGNDLTNSEEPPEFVSFGTKRKVKSKPVHHGGNQKHMTGHNHRTPGKGNRIVGGSDASPNEYPFYVNWGSQCGGSLIYEDVVLTAAHCAGIETNDVNVGAYENVDYISNPSSASGVIRTISERFVHPDYVAETITNDFMLLKLSESVTEITPVPLNDDRFSPSSGDSLTAIGLGRLQHEGDTPSILQEVEILGYSDSECDAIYDGFNDDVTLCAGVSVGEKGVCSGDSGGPLIDANGRQVGISSWVIICGDPRYPSAFARVSAVKQDWIDQMICEISSNPPASCGGDDDDDDNGAVDDDDNDDDGGSSSRTVTVAIMTDAYPSEIGWSIGCNGSATTITERETGYYIDAHSIHYDEVELTAGGTYWFRITDSAGDGFCCSYGGDGFYGLYLNDSFQFLFNVWGDIGYGAEHQFTV